MYDQQLYKVLKDYIKPKVLKKNNRTQAKFFIRTSFLVYELLIA